MKNQENEKVKRKIVFSDTWFWKNVVDNKFVSVLFISLLLFLTIFIFTKIAYVFEPLRLGVSLIAPPIVFAALLYYLINPIVEWLINKGLRRNLSIILVFIGILLVIALSITFIIPGIRDQINELIIAFPRIWETVLLQVEELLYTDWLTQIYQEIQATNIIERVTSQITNLFSVTIDSLGSLIGVLSRLTITVATLPFVLYYMLVDKERFKHSIIKLTPTRMRGTMHKFMVQASEQVGAYVRGQLVVALLVGIIFYVGYRIIDLEYALILSLAAGILNLVPYLGSIMASIPALIIGAFVSPLKFVQVVLVIIVEQTLEGRVVSPLILGNELDIHPLTILFLLLVSGSIFGFMGLVLAVPGFAVLRVIWNLFFEWVQRTYDLYDEVEITDVNK